MTVKPVAIFVFGIVIVGLGVNQIEWTSGNSKAESCANKSVVHNLSISVSLEDKNNQELRVIDLTNGLTGKKKSNCSVLTSSTSSSKFQKQKQIFDGKANDTSSRTSEQANSSYGSRNDSQADRRVQQNAGSFAGYDTQHPLSWTSLYRNWSSSQFQKQRQNSKFETNESSTQAARKSSSSSGRNISSQTKGQQHSNSSADYYAQHSSSWSSEHGKRNSSEFQEQQRNSDHKRDDALNGTSGNLSSSYGGGNDSQSYQPEMKVSNSSTYYSTHNSSSLTISDLKKHKQHSNNKKDAASNQTSADGNSSYSSRNGSQAHERVQQNISSAGGYNTQHSSSWSSQHGHQDSLQSQEQKQNSDSVTGVSNQTAGKANDTSSRTSEQANSSYGSRNDSQADRRVQQNAGSFAGYDTQHPLSWTSLYRNWSSSQFQEQRQNSEFETNESSTQAARESSSSSGRNISSQTKGQQHSNSSADYYAQHSSSWSSEHGKRNSSEFQEQQQYSDYKRDDALIGASGNLSSSYGGGNDSQSYQPEMKDSNSSTYYSTHNSSSLIISDLKKQKQHPNNKKDAASNQTSANGNSSYSSRNGSQAHEQVQQNTSSSASYNTQHSSSWSFEHGKRNSSEFQEQHRYSDHKRDDALNGTSWNLSSSYGGGNNSQSYQPEMKDSNSSIYYPTHNSSSLTISDLKKQKQHSNNKTSASNQMSANGNSSYSSRNGSQAHEQVQQNTSSSASYNTQHSSSWSFEHGKRNSSEFQEQHRYSDYKRDDVLNVTSGNLSSSYGGGNDSQSYQPEMKDSNSSTYYSTHNSSSLTISDLKKQKQHSNNKKDAASNQTSADGNSPYSSRNGSQAHEQVQQNTSSSASYNTQHSWSWSSEHGKRNSSEFQEQQRYSDYKRDDVLNVTSGNLSSSYGGGNDSQSYQPEMKDSNSSTYYSTHNSSSLTISDLKKHKQHSNNKKDAASNQTSANGNSSYSSRNVSQAHEQVQQNTSSSAGYNTQHSSSWSSQHGHQDNLQSQGQKQSSDSVTGVSNQTAGKSSSFNSSNSSSQADEREQQDAGFMADDYTRYSSSGNSQYGNWNSSLILSNSSSEDFQIDIRNSLEFQKQKQNNASSRPDVHCKGDDELISVRDVTRSERLFSLGLYKILMENGPANLAVSTANTFISLAEIFYGAAGKTKAELKVALQLPSPYCYDPLRGYEIAMDRIENFNSQDAALAHGMYASPKLEVTSGFRQIVQKSFHSNIKRLTNKGSPAKWFTKNGNPYGMLLSRFVSAENIDGHESIILLGGSYIKGTWLNEFHRCTERLKIDGGSTYGTSESASMQLVGKFNHGELPEVDASFIEMPLMDVTDRGNGRIFIILPNQAHGIHKLESEMNEKMIGQKIFKGISKTVNVILPEFIIEYHLDLVETLRKMQLNHMFNDDANFQNLTDTSSAKVNLFLHKIVIHGRATSGTTTCNFDIVEDASGNDAIQFKADHPFLIVVAIDDENPMIVAIARFAVANDNF